jgi:hypothetical protein
VVVREALVVNCITSVVDDCEPGVVAALAATGRAGNGREITSRPDDPEVLGVDGCGGCQHIDESAERSHDFDCGVEDFKLLMEWD